MFYIKFSDLNIIFQEGLPPIKVHCSVLAEQAVKAALSDYYRRQGIDPEPIVGKLEEDCDHCSGESCGR